MPAKIINVSIGECETDARDDGKLRSSRSNVRACGGAGPEKTFSSSTGDDGAE